MTHKKIIKLLVFNILCIQAFGQSFILQGLTKDENNNILPYVSFFCNNKIIGVSNELGEFNFQLADSLKFDSIKCTYLGYHPITRSVIEFSFSSNNLLVFKKTSYSLSSVLIKSKKQYVFDGTKILGAKRNKPQGKYYLNNGHLVGTLIKNNLSKVAIIKNAYFYITNEGFPDTKFRVRIYEADTFGIPQRELLDSNYFGQGSIAGNEWVTVSLKQANIKFPPYGVIVVMEWLPLAKDKVTKKPWGNNEIVYEGQCLGGTNEFKFINNYFNYRHGSELRKEMPIEGVKMFNYLNPMIRLELDVVK